MSSCLDTAVRIIANNDLGENASDITFWIGGGDNLAYVKLIVRENVRVKVLETVTRCCLVTCGVYIARSICRSR
jgi:hypothetical protein